MLGFLSGYVQIWSEVVSWKSENVPYRLENEALTAGFPLDKILLKGKAMRILRIVSILLTLFLLVPASAEAPAASPTPLPEAYSIDRLTAEAALLIDADTGDILYSRNSRVRMYPASTTKIMTLLLALESGISLDEQVTIPSEAGNVPANSSVVPVYPGDVMTWRDLLYGFMLNSGNDGANAIAVISAGKISAFVDRMNARAQELGCSGTHFVNAHGYHDSDHYTTAQDLALISAEAMKNPEFREIVAAPHWDMTIARKGGTVIQKIDSRVSLLIEGQKYFYPACTGIKTGHTGKAGWCFVGSATRDGVNLIAVVLKCPEEMDKFFDAARLWEYGFSMYEAVPLPDILVKAVPPIAVVVENAAQDDETGGRIELNFGGMTVTGTGKRMINTSLVGAMEAAVAEAAGQYRFELSRELSAPVVAGETLGTLIWETEEGTVSATLVASRDVLARQEAPAAAPPARTGSTLPLVALGGALLVALVALIAVAFAARRSRKKRKKRKPQAPGRQRRSGGSIHGR